MPNPNFPDPSRFQFRGLRLGLLIGTASDRYAGWIGQVYSKGRYEKGVTRRTHQVGDQSFGEEILPVESVQEYFEHFPILEIDYTFYRPLLERDGKPTQNFHVLAKYRQYLKDHDLLLLKVPQGIAAKRLRRGKGFIENPDYLDAELFTNQFYRPAVEILGPCLNGFIFEQEYHRQKERLPVERMAQDLEEFLRRIPRDSRYHFELRTEAYLGDPVFEVLQKEGVGLVYSHWTWLPPLGKQWLKTKGRSFNSGNQVVIRLLTPLRMNYEESYAKAFPFNKMVEGMLNPKMLEEALEIIDDSLKQNRQVNLIINNRAGGNAPSIAQELAARIQS